LSGRACIVSLGIQTGAVVTDVRGLVRLLQRAEWTRLSLSADVSDGSKVLIAPGTRYRYETAGYLTGCDGGRPWELDEDEDDRNKSVHWVSGPQAPLARLLCPAWLLDSSLLEVRGNTRACGRDALDVVMTRRPTLRTGLVAADDPTEVVEVLVDAESGILLRVPDLDDDGGADVLELVRADFSPVIDEYRFQPPPGSRIAEGFGDAFSGPLRPAWVAATTVGGLAAGALGAWIRYSPSRRTATSGSGVDYAAEIPRDEPTPDRGHDRAPVSDGVLDRLYTGGPTELQATVHDWLDIGAMTASVPEPARRAGLGGLGLLMDALSEKSRAGHTVTEIRFAGPGTYQIDRRYQQQRRLPTTIACDGQRSWQVYADKITTGPAQRPPADVGALTDPSWLLRWTLSRGEAVTLGGRAAYRISATRRTTDGYAGPTPFPAAVAVVDLDLGVILRLTSYIGDNPVQRYELRDITTSVGDFRLRIPDGLPVVERARRGYP
jgi:hypothetical protein